MIRDFSSGTHELPVYDICIIGSGPAGMILCGELAESGARIAVIESGSYGRSAFTDGLRRVETSGLTVRDTSRERVLGGTSEVWGGLSAPLDPIDFEGRNFLKDSIGWPITAEEIGPDLERAAERYRFPPLASFRSDVFLSEAEKEEVVWRGLDAKVFLAVRPPIQFGKEMQNIFRGIRIDLLQNLTALELRCAHGIPQAVTEVVCKTASGVTTSIRARVFVLAAGTIENVRLLLNSKQTSPKGLGNAHDQIGRYFMNHPKGYIGRITLSRRFPRGSQYFWKKSSYGSGYIGLRLSEAVQRSDYLLNSYLRLEQGFPWTNRKEIILARTLAHSARAFIRNPSRKDLLALLKLMPSGLRALPVLCVLGATRLARGKTPTHLLPRYFLEMEPRAENRITLSTVEDALGVPIARVHHELSSPDIKSFWALRDQVGCECERLGIGSYVYGDDLPLEDASHHLGGTRMGNDPQNSGVDRNLRVHGLDNLYVAGGSVFPSSGCANPTMMIAALSIRLARHLQDMLPHQNAPSSPVPHTALPLLLIGSGRRVISDILPVIESLPEQLFISKVFARRSRMLFGTRRTYKVDPLSQLEDADIAAARFVYVSTPTREVPLILRALAQYDCAHIDLILPTPISKTSMPYWSAFNRVIVEEDSVYLPWIEAARRACGPLRRLVFDRSAYRYHAVALIKKLCGGDVRTRFRFGKRTWFWLPARAMLIEPRDYSMGHMSLVGKWATASDMPGPGIVPIELLGKNTCTAVRAGKEVEYLTKEESDLFGNLAAGDTVITRMHDFKRVGLRRLLEATRIGEGWAAQQGLDDAQQAGMTNNAV